jgi:hypothetical protein
MQISIVTMSCPSLRTVVPPPCLPLGIKDLKEYVRFFDGGLLAFGCGRLLEGKLLKGKGLLKWNC